jgi:hypothetical protein
MDLGNFRCRHCRGSRRRRSLDQSYCSEPGCQKARKNAWRRAKYAADPDYRANQGDSDRAWLETQGGAAEYHRQYRRRRRNSRRRERVSADPVATAKSANSDAAPPKSHVDSTVYVLVPADPGHRANSDLVLAKFLMIPSSCDGSANIDSIVASANAD